MLTIVAVGLVLYLLFGVVGSVSGSGLAEAWLYPLPVFIAIGSGMALVRYRRG
jgi:Na+/proline symporter